MGTSTICFPLVEHLRIKVELSGHTGISYEVQWPEDGIAAIDLLDVIEQSDGIEYSLAFHGFKIINTHAEIIGFDIENKRFIVRRISDNIHD